MRQITVNAESVDLYSRSYSSFRGVDFSTDSTQVDASRSPGAVNMISDMSGFPEKRTGWRYLHKFDSTVHQLFYAVFADGTRGLYAHVETDLYSWQEPDEETQTEHAPVLLLEGCLADARSAHFVHRGKVYLLDGTKYRVLTHDDEGYHMTAVEDDEPYIPTLRINVTGNEVVQIGSTNQYYGGHTYEEYEDANVLTYKRKVTMCGDGSSKRFFVGETDIDSVDSITVAGTALAAEDYDVNLVTGRIKFSTAPAIDEDGAGLANIEVIYSKKPTERDEMKETGTGTKKDFTLPDEAVGVALVYVDGSKLAADTDYTVDIDNHNIKLTTAAGNGKEVRIVYTKSQEEYEMARIDACTICDTFGYYNDNRFFITGEGNAKHLNCDYMSETDDPTYFPYTGFVRVGSDTSRIMGYLKQYDSQLVIKEDNGQDAQIYMRTAEEVSSDTTDDEVLFPLKQGIEGVGAVSKEAFAVLRDNPLFLAKEGVYSIASGEVKDQQSTQDMSYFVNKRLTAEEGLENACAGVWGNYYILAVNGHAYVADARQRTGSSDTEYSGYEWYYWTNIPAVFFFNHEGTLYFTSGQDICRMNDDYSATYKYSDGSWPMKPISQLSEAEQAEYADLLAESVDKARSYRRSINPGVAIEAVWTTKSDTFDTIIQLKSIPKKGTAVMVKPYTRSSVDIAYITNREGEKTVKSGVQMDIFDFNDLDFERLTFNTLDLPQVIPLAKKIKKFNIIQFIVRSKELNEGFGLYGIQLTYTLGRYVK